MLLRSLWERGRRVIDGAEPAEGFGMTWYAAGDDDAPDDPRAWRKSSPALVEGRIDEATIRDELRGLTASTFRRERLNLWSDAADEWLPPGVWSRQVGDRPETRRRVVLAVDAAPDWSRASIAVAIEPDRRRADVRRDRRGSRAPLPARASIPTLLLEALGTDARGSGRRRSCAWSRASSVGASLRAWAGDVDVETLELGAVDLRSASELFRAELVGRRLVHADDPLLAVQARRARPSGELTAGAWYFSVRESSGRDRRAPRGRVGGVGSALPRGERVATGDFLAGDRRRRASPRPPAPARLRLIPRRDPSGVPEKSPN